MRIDTDSHTHPFQQERDLDGIRLFVETAIEKGLKKIVFSEHAPLAERWSMHRHFLRFSEYEKYLLCCEQLKREYRDRITVVTGAELDYDPDEIETLERVLNLFPLEHRGLSIHLHAPHWSERVSKLSETERIHLAFDMTLEGIKTHLFSSLNHLDFIRWHCPSYRPDDYEAEIRTIYEELVKAGMSLELNTSGLDKAFSDMLLCRKAWEWSFDYPLKRVYGSDAHEVSQIARHFEKIQHGENSYAC